MLSRRLFPVAGLALLALLRDAVVDLRTNIERRKAANRDRALRRMSSPQQMDAGYRTLDAVRRYINLSDVELFDYGGPIGFAAIRLPY